MLKNTVSLVFLFLATSLACQSKDFGNGGTVCVCSKDYCDSLPPVTRLASNKYEIYTSSIAGDRFTRTTGTFSPYNSNNNPNSILRIDRSKKFQKILGFGGAFTDSAGINILSLSAEVQKKLLELTRPEHGAVITDKGHSSWVIQPAPAGSYFSENGIQYSMGRIIIAGNDFSTRGYTYDDVVDDFELKFFSLQEEDINYKIPIILKALNLTQNDFKLFASAWSAPAWMKTNNKLSGIGFLNMSMYDVWADYYIKFLDAYRQNGINLWGLTTGNEPGNGLVQYIIINDMAWDPQEQAQWIAQHLGPKLRLNKYYYDIKIIIVDDQRTVFPYVPRHILQNPIANQYVDGIGVHYYFDKYVDADVLSITHFEHPDKFILATEGCEGFLAKRPVILGSWDRAENYLDSIFDDLNNWSTGFVDLNIALNLQGGPTYVENYVDSPIIVNKTSDEFYKQPTFYAMGHFSKFLRPDSVRVGSTYSGSGLKHVVFERPDGGVVVSVFNPSENNVSITISDVNLKNNINMNVTRRSMNSVLYW